MILREELSTPPEKLKVYQAYELMGQKEKQSKEKGLHFAQRSCRILAHGSMCLLF